MPSTRYRLGDLVELVDERNSFGIRNFCGVNIDKEFMPTVADTTGLDETKYKVVRKNRFVFSGMQTGRDECIRISMYTEDEPCIVSPAYITFEVKATEVVSPWYFFMNFRSKEKDRLGWFLSDSSVRSNLDWDVFCDIELDLPPLEVQEKYAAVYRALLANKRAYESSLDNLKRACDAEVEHLKKTLPGKSAMPSTRYRLGDLVEISEVRNDALAYGDADVRGISIGKKFIPTKADMEGVPLGKYLVVAPDDFAYVTITSRNGEKITIAHNDSQLSFIVSSSYIVFRVNRPDILSSDFLFLYLNRPEFDRYARFHSWGSTREAFTWEEMQDVAIPIPDIGTQSAVAALYAAYRGRRVLVERLDNLLKSICPVLVRGAQREAER